MPSDADVADEIAEIASHLALHALDHKFDALAYILECAVTEARRMSELKRLARTIRLKKAS